MQLSPIPSNIQSIEDLILWATVALDSKAYPPLTLSANAEAAPPVSLMVSRASTGANIGNPYARISLNIPLDSGAVNRGALYESALPFESADTVPASMIGTGEGGGGSSSGPSIYSVPADTWRWFIGEDMIYGGDGGISDSPELIGRTGGKAVLTSPDSSQDVSIGYFNSNPGLLYGGNYLGGFSLDSSQNSEAWTVVFCGAVHGAESGYVSVFDNAEYNSIFIGFNSDFWIDFPADVAPEASSMTPDSNHHVWAVTIDETSANFYIDSQLVSSESTSYFGPVDIDFILYDQSSFEPFFMSDYLVIPRALPQSEITSLCNEIMTYRGIGQ